MRHSCNLRDSQKVLVFCSLIVFAVIGCERKITEADPRLSTPQKTYELWLETAEKGDVVASLECITEDSKKLVDLQAKGRDVFLGRLTAQAKFFHEYRITETKFKEERAVILLAGPKGDNIVIPFKKEAVGWKVDLIAMFNM